MAWHVFEANSSLHILWILCLLCLVTTRSHNKCFTCTLGLWCWRDAGEVSVYTATNTGMAVNFVYAPIITAQYWIEWTRNLQLNAGHILIYTFAWHVGSLTYQKETQSHINWMTLKWHDKKSDNSFSETMQFNWVSPRGAVVWDVTLMILLDSHTGYFYRYILLLLYTNYITSGKNENTFLAIYICI